MGTLLSLPICLNADDIWRWVQSYDDAWDLTRSAEATAVSPGLVRMTGQKSMAVLDWSKTALMVIDMQSSSLPRRKENFMHDSQLTLAEEDVYLHEHIAKSFDAGRAIVPTAIDFVLTLRKSGVKILWSNVRVHCGIGHGLWSSDPSLFMSSMN